MPAFAVIEAGLPRRLSPACTDFRVFIDGFGFAGVGEVADVAFGDEEVAQIPEVLCEPPGSRSRRA